MPAIPTRKHLEQAMYAAIAGFQAIASFRERILGCWQHHIVRPARVSSGSVQIKEFEQALGEGFESLADAGMRMEQTLTRPVLLQLDVGKAKASEPLDVTLGDVEANTYHELVRSLLYRMGKFHSPFAPDVDPPSWWADGISGPSGRTERYHQPMITYLKALRLPDTIDEREALLTRECGRAIDALGQSAIEGRGNGKRRRRRTVSMKPLTGLQRKALELCGLHQGKLADIAREMDITRQAASKHLDAAWRKLPGLAPRKGGKPGRTRRMPTNRRGQADV